MKAIKLSPADNVATLLGDVAKNEWVEIISADNEVIAEIKALQKIPFGNKIALCDIAHAEHINKCGHSIGKSIIEIPLGQLVHVQNVRSERLDIPESIIEEIIKQMGIEQ
ncbi:TPA: UxaA family hydrolase [Photobacterium damselae]|uniref:Carbohydrate kinase n=3 Tax=Photobacterium damselae TaxID=38293 RepID=A0A2T3ICZ7_PHODM|nr:UxaA family hydrolase [Photobacterium damselae]EHA1080052.1 UxaA family hydrolase [Photobacterium damselae]EJN6959292.1 UxaA family hydrolase [Photobacterium damselae]EJN6962008.1 UxaA family hydrolase [Photobacterium damselae]ELI6449332.1 UxaA family hydrolase [Photobacterium damselae]ELV7516424.1 UxaA family hydrolase [Photobacterium damselae]